MEDVLLFCPTSLNRTNWTWLLIVFCKWWVTGMANRRGNIVHIVEPEAATRALSQNIARPSKRGLNNYFLCFSPPPFIRPSPEPSTAAAAPAPPSLGDETGGALGPFDWSLAGVCLANLATTAAEWFPLLKSQNVDFKVCGLNWSSKCVSLRVTCMTAREFAKRDYNLANRQPPRRPSIVARRRRM